MMPPLLRGLLGAFLAEACYLGMVDPDGTVWESRRKHFGSRQAIDIIKAAAQADLALELLTGGQRGTLAHELTKRFADVAEINDGKGVHGATCGGFHASELPDLVLRDGLARARKIIAKEGLNNKRRGK